MIQIPGLNRRNLDLLIDKVINVTAVFIEFELTSYNIQNIYDHVLSSSHALEQAIKEQYHNGNIVPVELTEEGKMQHRKRMLRRYGSLLEKLSDKAEPYQNDLKCLLLPEDIAHKLKELMDYHLKLIGLQSGYASMSTQTISQTPPQTPL